LKSNLTAARALLAAGISLISVSCAPSEHMRVNREVGLSEHTVSALGIVHAPDGYVVIGSANVSESQSWAMRVDSTGKTRWEFLDVPPPVQKTGVPGPATNRFQGAVALPDDRTLLC
jgi:hypothetical protein